MDDCIFCKIIKKEIPCYELFESEKVLAFLDVNPMALGHCLVIPKKHFSNILEIEEDYLSEIMMVAKKLSLKMNQDFKAEGVDLFQANCEAGEQTVFHYHLHVIPRKKGDGIDFSAEMVRNIKKIDSAEFEKIRNALTI